MKIPKKKPVYLRVPVPGDKLYYAVLNGSVSKCSFETATQAEAYAQAWKSRYIRLKIAKVKHNERSSDSI